MGIMEEMGTTSISNVRIVHPGAEEKDMTFTPLTSPAIHMRNGATQLRMGTKPIRSAIAATTLMWS